MQTYTYGQITFDRPVPDDLRAKAFSLFEGTSAVFSGDGTVFTLSDCPWDCQEELNAVMDLMEENDIRAVPEESSFRYYGDYDGGYLMEDGVFFDFDYEDYLIRTLPTEALERELNRRNLGGKP